ncbi:nucleotidyltransferase family protein [Fibrobacter succinogenes]|jgi:predicted nucleotidyltransferase|uniref:nucleotidyltransferase family protein n=1 Tax=Fibrobacter succinogenes TaxID=833 RepID=UPI0015688063|nr:nucleotidyltransferase domain-containing protein [Fibrobacter succinogenes]
MDSGLYLKKISLELNTLARTIKVINEVGIFGSYAKGTASASSDLDVYIMCDDNSAYGYIIKELSCLTKKYNKFIHPVVYDKPKIVLFDNSYIKSNIFDNSILVYKRDHV